MTPILYEKDEIDFTSQGLGSLVEIYDADVAEQRNGLLQFTASYPVTGVRYDDISVGRIILAKPNQRDEPHAFRITIADLDIMGHNVMIEADSITYDLNHNIIKHLNVSGADGQTMLSALKNAIVNPSIFTFYSDITHVSSTSLDYVNPMEAVMGVKGSFLQIWGGELKRENRRVAMFNRRGRDNVATFRLGKNISGLKYKVDISSLVTRILPIKSVQENDTTTYLEGTPVSSQYINSYEQIYTIKVDFTDDTIKTVDDLNKASANWFVDSANTARDKPSVTIDIDVLSLQDSADYQDKFKDLESVALTDTVTVYVPEYGINVTAIVNELHFDPIQERVTKLTVGTAKQSFADSSRTQLSDLQDQIISVQNQADAAAVSANGKNKNYYGSVEPSHPQEGDLWYWKNGDLSGIKQFVNGEWVDLVDSATEQKISDSVDKAVTDAKTYSDQAIATNREQIDAEIKTVSDKTAQLESEQAELDTKAKGYADKALADAKADIQATAQQTAQDAQTALNNAETTLQQEISQNVSQADYDAKTGDLSLKVSTAQQTADGAVTTIGNYKQSNDGRMASAESKITANATAITQKVSQTDYDTKTGQIDGQISTINQTATGISQSVSNVQAQVNNLQVGGRNLYLNSRALAEGYGTNGNVTVTVEPFDSTTNMWHIVAPQGTGTGIGIYLWDYGKEKIPDNLDWSYSADVKGTGKVVQFGIELGNKNPVIGTIGSDWSRISQTGHVDKVDYKTIIMYFDTTGSPLDVYIKLPKLEVGNLPTAWTPAPEDTDNKISTVSQTVDSISSIVSDPTTGLTKRVQTAEGTLSQVTGADIPALQKATYWQPFTSLDLNTYMKQGSFFFNSTEVKPNGPTTMTNWMYLVVEQGTSDSGRVVQTAWYDTQTDAKITYRRQYAGAWSPWYANDNDSVTTIAQTNGVIQQEISNRVTGDTNTLTQAKDFTTSSISNSESGMRSQITQTSDAILGKVSETGVRYVRINGQGNQDNAGTHFMRVSLFDSSGKDLLLGKTATVSGPNSPYFGGNNGGNGATDGNVNTYAAIYPEPNVNNFMVYDLGTVTYTAQRFEVKMLTNYRAYKGVTIQVSPDNKSWRTILQEDIKSVSGDITKPDTTINLGGTSSATQLALLKDNWSIGIADNAGAITSGIVGNSSNMSLISNNVVINAPSTQIKGTAWINSAMIGNGAIGTAQIGDAAITSAKIANLDVSKITGNVTNFIQSNWNGVYESTTITNNGMKIVTSDVTTYFGTYGIKLNQGGESVGGIGVSSYVGMPDNFQGIAFNLDGTGDYMTWGARASGVTTGDYATKLAWFRSSYKPSGQNAGFNFSDDSPVTFWGDIYGRENTEPLKIAAFGMKGISAGGLGHGNGSSAITFGGDGETYIISSGTYYHLTQLVKALQPLIGLGTWSAPKNINSNGVVTQWTNVTT